MNIKKESGEVTRNMWISRVRRAKDSLIIKKDEPKKRHESGSPSTWFIVSRI